MRSGRSGVYRIESKSALEQFCSLYGIEGHELYEVLRDVARVPTFGSPPDAWTTLSECVKTVDSAAVIAWGTTKVLAYLGPGVVIWIYFARPLLRGVAKGVEKAAEEATYERLKTRITGKRRKKND